MKKIILSVVAALVLLTTLNAQSYAFGTTRSLNLKYPIILVHGWSGFDVMFGVIEYFWNIKRSLENQGATVFVADLDAFGVDFDPAQYGVSNPFYRGETPTRSEQLRACILEVLAITGAEKVNLIAHSQGGITARYCISNMTDGTGKPMYPKVASLVMISTPNRGTFFANLILGVSTSSGLAQWITDILANTVWGKLLCGDANANFQAPGLIMKKEYMINVFNPNNPDITPAHDRINGIGVKYYSYAGLVRGMTSNAAIYPIWRITSKHDGPGDGIVSVESAKWGEWMGTLYGLFGVDHWMETNQLFGITPGFDCEGFYYNTAKMLEKDGF